MSHTAHWAYAVEKVYYDTVWQSPPTRPLSQVASQTNITHSSRAYAVEKVYEVWWSPPTCPSSIGATQTNVAHSSLGIHRGKGQLWHSLTVTHLPPIGIIHVENLEDITFGEGKSGFATGNQVVLLRVVTKVCLHEYLQTKKRHFLKHRSISKTIAVATAFNKSGDKRTPVKYSISLFCLIVPPKTVCLFVVVLRPSNI